MKFTEKAKEFTLACLQFFFIKPLSFKIHAYFIPKRARVTTFTQKHLIQPLLMKKTVIIAHFLATKNSG